MSKKTLNKANLAELGADRLADLLIEISTGSADIKRRLRLELSHNLGTADLAHEVRKRLASLRKAKSYISWRKRKAVIKDLNTQVAMIVEKIAPSDPKDAFELLWQFVDLAPFIFQRVDDSRGDVADVFRAAIVPRAELDCQALADRVWSAMCDNNYGEWDGIVGILAPALGEDGLLHLKAQVEDYERAQAKPEDQEHEAILFLRELRGGSDYKTQERQRFVKRCLQEIAAVRGDTAAYIAQYSCDDLRTKAIAAEVAMLLLEADKPLEALTVLTDAQSDLSRFGQEDYDDAWIAALLALGRAEEAQAHRWACFQERLSLPLLRDYLKQLPDFEDVEAEAAARAHLLGYPDVMRALAFCMEWNDLATLAQLVDMRVWEIDGDLYEALSPAADALRDRYPLAATLLWRAMINDALSQGRSSRYGYAVHHLNDCAAVSNGIADFGGHETHEAYCAALRLRHEAKMSFWAKLEGRT